MTGGSLNGPVPPDRFLPFLDWETVRDLPDKADTVIVLPVGATEQHGPHLPLYVDTAIATEVTARALERLEPEIPAYALPPIWCGKSNEHGGFPGTVSLRVETLLGLVHDIGTSLYEAGFRKLILANGHGGQPQALEIAARDLRAAHSDLIVFPWNIWAMAPGVQDHLPERERAEGMHAGTAETSLMLALRPESVAFARAPCEYPPERPEGLTPEGPHPFAWLTRDLSRTGVIGDATRGAAADGERMLETLVAAWVQGLRTAYRFRMPSSTSHRV